MAAIAATAGVSKALLHYHYADRGRLLTEVATQLAHRIVGRERAAMQDAKGSGTVDALWQWLEGELGRGELRTLLELGLLRDADIHAASVEAAELRRRSAAETVERLFAGLGLTPRMPSALLGAVSVALIDGLAASASHHDARASFDVVWLALLGLAE